MHPLVESRMKFDLWITSVHHVTILFIRMCDPSLGKLASARAESFHEGKDVIKIEESLAASHCSHMSIHCRISFKTVGFLREVGL